MKTSTPEVLCDGCGKTIDILAQTAIYITLRGPKIGHKKADFCDEQCIVMWAMRTCGDTK